MESLSPNLGAWRHPRGVFAVPDADALREMFVHLAGCAGEHACLHVGFGPAGRELKYRLIGGLAIFRRVGDRDRSNNNDQTNGSDKGESKPLLADRKNLRE
jgi:hypothetical protein